MKLVNLAIYRPIATTMLVLVLTMMGIFAWIQMPVDLFPPLSFPILAVLTPMEGASPTEVENFISIPLEKILTTVPYVKRIQSRSTMGYSLLTLEFEWKTNMDLAALQVRETIDLILGTLPREIKKPSVFRFNPQMLPIMELAITSKDLTLEQLSYLVVETIQPSLEAIPGIAQVQTDGRFTSQVILGINASDLASTGVSPQELLQWIQLQNQMIPAGTIEENHRQYPLRYEGNLQSIDHLRKLLIPTPKSGPRFLEELVSITYEQRPNPPLIFLNGKPSIQIALTKMSDTNTLYVTEQILKRLASLQENASFQAMPIYSQANYIEEALDNVKQNIYLGSTLAIGILFFFLRRWQSILVISLAIPFSIIVTLLSLFFLKQSINILTLGGLALGVGLMVDNSIIVYENIHRYRQLGLSSRDSAHKGTMEVAYPVLASTLTTIAVFVPLLFIKGITAQILHPLSFSIIFSLLASLLGAYLLVPMIAAHEQNKKQWLKKTESWIESWKKTYQSLLRFALKYPKLTISILVTLILASLPLYFFLGKEFLPPEKQNLARVEIRLPPGTDIEKTKEVTLNIDHQLSLFSQEIKSRHIQVGERPLLGQDQVITPHRGRITITPHSAWSSSQEVMELVDTLRMKLQAPPGVRLEVKPFNLQQEGRDQQLQLQILGNDMEQLQRIAVKINEKLEKISGISHVQSTADEEHPEYVLKADPISTSFHGLHPGLILQQILQQTKKELVTQLQIGDHWVPVIMQPKSHPSLYHLKQTDILTPQGAMQPLSNFVQSKEARVPNTIQRMHHQRQLLITIHLHEIDVGTAMKQLRQELKHFPLPPGYSISFTGEVEQMGQALSNLSMALVISILLVYMLLAAQFESLYLPFLIILAIPSTCIGVLVGLTLFDQPLGVPAFIGMLILAGLTVNSSIIMITFLEQLREEGIPLEEAVIKAGITRLRPISMTVLTTILGLFPTMMGWGDGTQLLQPMATVVIFGLLTSTLLTLFAIPTTYFLIESKKLRRKSQSSL
ncbi:efflux RND transporter permease subunit [Rubeoparvulum massiliense]|uniref:efflux RND transporter permease subunit n=1 Tax=Rubeoparvulum massiliense TaxID=1631346 RepID=UPI00065DEA97|nr:efflux RND transporter permease subunit [Rubeoparvulum massiliense]